MHYSNNSSKTLLHCGEELYNIEFCTNWGTKTVNRHSTYPGLFAGSHLLSVQKPLSKCYVIEWFIGMIAQQPSYYTLLDAVRGLCAVKNRKGQRVGVTQSETK